MAGGAAEVRPFASPMPRKISMNASSPIIGFLAMALPADAIALVVTNQSSVKQVEFIWIFRIMAKGALLYVRHMLKNHFTMLLFQIAIKNALFEALVALHARESGYLFRPRCYLKLVGSLFCKGRQGKQQGYKPEVENHFFHTPRTCLGLNMQFAGKFCHTFR